MPIPAYMRAMVLERVGGPLALRELPVPGPGPGQVLLRVQACGVCRTDLHVLDGDLAEPKLPLILGHEVVGAVMALGDGVTDVAIGQRMGVPWLGHTDGTCRYCASGRENLCTAAGFTGYTMDGGYAEFTVADHRYCFEIPGNYDALHAAPLLCAGLIGYRAYRLAGPCVGRLGLYGFGAAAHLIAQVAVQQGVAVYAFTRPGDAEGQAFARDLGATWAGGSTTLPPEPLDAAIIFAPVGSLVVEALKAVDRGGTVVCAGIHMSPIPTFAYELLWHERVIRSVANLTRADGVALMALAAELPLQVTAVPYALEDANQALDDLRQGRLNGAAVLTMDAGAR